LVVVRRPRDLIDFMMSKIIEDVSMELAFLFWQLKMDQ